MEQEVELEPSFPLTDELNGVQRLVNGLTETYEIMYWG